MDLLPRKLWVIAAVAITSGLLLGALDLIAQRELPYPWANLANSSAVWAIGAFAIGTWARSGTWRPALAGIVLLVVAVEAYYVTATLVQNDDLANIWSSTTFLWLLFGILAGTVFGIAGAWSRDKQGWRQIAALAMPGAVCLAEAAVGAYRSAGADAAYRTDNLQTAGIMLTLGILLPLITGRTARLRLSGLAASLPLAAIGFAGFLAAGFG